MIARLTKEDGSYMYVIGTEQDILDQAEHHSSETGPAPIAVCARMPTREEMLAGTVPTE